LDDLFSYGLRVLREDLQKNTYGRVFVVRWVTAHFTAFRSVSKVTGYKLDDQDLIPGTGRVFYLCCHIHTGFGSHPSSCVINTVGALSCNNAARVWSWLLTSI
jgi:hypothetical protein